MGDHLEIDLKGLAKLLERKGVEWVALELVQNAWDTATSEITITLAPVPGKPMVELVVEDDDPEGFIHLSDAWTLFAESLKKDNPEQRGRFNIGEKLVLAYALAYGGSVEIMTTKGTVVFDQRGRHHYGKTERTRKRGSLVRAVVRMTRKQVESTERAIRALIPPVPTDLNGEALPVRIPLTSTTASLPTEIADEEGVLRRSVRKTTIEMHEVLPGETASIYEMGIPIVDTGDKWHVNVLQKVPLNMERDNVPPSFLKAVRVAVLNATIDLIEKDDATEAWVQEATSDKRCEAEAVTKVLDHRFGEKRVSYDPSDPEANKRAVAEGYAVVHGGSLTKGQWENVRKVVAVKPAGQVTPTPKPVHPDGDPLKMLPKEKWGEGVKRVVAFAKKAGFFITRRQVTVDLCNDPKWGFSAAYGQGKLTLSYNRLGKAWFEAFPKEDAEPVLRLLIHEFAHEWSGDHLSREYYDALCKVGARMALFLMSNKLKG